LTKRELRVYSRSQESAADRGDVTIEVWSPGAESAQPRTIGFVLRRWAPLAAGAGLIAAALMLLTRRRIRH
jgi:hypothetical protein